ncbi:MAG: immunomodulating metalloprotease, partial [Pseudomonadota bacterium]|nr:immunomodulating metalloprotease [Pseudomonadota bacterium]
IPLSQTALDSVADLNLPQAARSFYALQAGKHNQLATGQWLAIETAMPAYPW